MWCLHNRIQNDGLCNHLFRFASLFCFQDFSIVRYYHSAKPQLDFIRMYCWFFLMIQLKSLSCYLINLTFKFQSLGLKIFLLFWMLEFPIDHIVNLKGFFHSYLYHRLKYSLVSNFIFYLFISDLFLSWLFDTKIEILYRHRFFLW